MPFAIINGMKTEITMDAAGRVVLPQPVRQQFHLTRGAVMDLEVGQESIILRPRDRTPTLVDDNGILVHEGIPVEDLLNAVDVQRQQRNQAVAGRML
jgi:bifunctional DNA-binding transcriptional regulator/antitoxin component of YhaV-PrlF toxin-antitoxin module